MCDSTAPVPRRVPVVRRRTVLLAAVSAVGAAILSAVAASPPLQGREAKPPSSARTATPAVAASRRPQDVGCSARACHGRATARPDGACGLNESTLWMFRDPHSSAYDVLRSERSLRISEALYPNGGPEPHTDDRCLACHDTPTHDAAGRLVWSGEGVSCVACHGDPADWLAEHVSIPDAEPGRTLGRERLGLRDLRDPAVCAETCAGCHVGRPSGPGGMRQEVDHDLIAAGHPRLHFELKSFVEAMPPHWRGDGPLRDPLVAWAAGQVAANEAWLALLAARAEAATSEDASERTGTWPEFTETSCFDCHHELRLDSGRPGDGRPEWGNFYAEFLPEALAALGRPNGERDAAVRAVAKVDRVMSSFAPPAVEARAAAAEARAALPDLKGKLPAEGDAAAVRRLLTERFRKGEPPAVSDWMTAGQLFHLAEALGTERSVTDEFLTRLRLPGRADGEALVDSPETFTPGPEFQASLDALLDALRGAPSEDP